MLRSDMERYGYEFDPVADRAGWFAAHNLEGDAAETAASRIHEEFDLGGDLVFCGTSPVDGHDKLFLIESGDPADVARMFEVGSQVDSAAVEVTAEMLEAIREVVPLSPIVVNRANYIARFTKLIDERLAEAILRVMEKYECQGLDWYASALPDLTDDEIVASIVSEQKLRLWWD